MKKLLFTLFLTCLLLVSCQKDVAKQVNTYQLTVNGYEGGTLSLIINNDTTFSGNIVKTGDVLYITKENDTLNPEQITVEVFLDSTLVDYQTCLCPLITIVHRVQ